MNMHIVNAFTHEDVSLFIDAFLFYFIMLLFSTNTHIGAFEMVRRCGNLSYLIFTSFFWNIVLVACMHLGCRVVNTRRGLEAKV
jgi:hypothetical protein